MIMRPNELGTEAVAPIHRMYRLRVAGKRRPEQESEPSPAHRREDRSAADAPQTAAAGPTPPRVAVQAA
jgi:hypothetical protein